MGRRLFDGGFTWPLLTLRESALAHNIETVHGFADAHGLLLAPHGKTTMAPALWRRQLDAGAWGITVADPHQARIALLAGVPRVLIANEVLDPIPLAWLAGEQGPDLELSLFVDSPQGVVVAREAVRRAGSDPLRLLVDLGYRGGRTGCRHLDGAAELAQAVVAAPELELAGVAGYESRLTDPQDVGSYFADLAVLAIRLHHEGMLPADAIVTAGGSAFFDLLAEVWAGDWDGMTPRRVLRSGCYLTHDHGKYAAKTPYRRMSGELRPALELWAQVVSAPEPGKAIVGFGRRDAPYDAGLPVPLRSRRPGGGPEQRVDGLVEDLDDQHAYLSTSTSLTPGELVCFGVSHPCTAFDKWRLLPIVDDSYLVGDLVRTAF